MNNKLYASIFAVIGIASIGINAPVHATGIVYQDGEKFVKFGGRIQVQYHRVDPDGGDSTDSLFLRRLRPEIEGSVHKDWVGKFQWDMGGAEDDDEIAIKDAYLQYKGYGNLNITFGNYTFPFSREQLTSSKYQQLVERTFVGDHNYGSVERQLGLYFDGYNDDKSTFWNVAIASAAIDPSNSKLDWDTLVNKESDFNEGWMIGGRLDFGGVKNSQANFKGENKWGFAIATFSWSNDEDNLNNNGSDVDAVTGVELSSAYRNGLLSIDAEYNRFDSELLQPSVGIQGIYSNGKTTLDTFALEGGILFNDNHSEFVLGVQQLDADGYAKTWGRTSVGYNWYLHEHDIKIQFTYQAGKNLNGVDGRDANELFVQTQYVF